MAGSRQSGRARRRLFLAAGVLVAVVAAAWVLEWAVNGRAEAPGAPAGATAYSVGVVRDGETLERFTVAELEALPQTRITSDGKAQAGPSVAAVLAAAGVQSGYDELEFRGMGVRDAGLLTLSARQVTPTTILDLSDRGTYKVVSPTLGFRERVRDVTAIVVR